MRTAVVTLPDRPAIGLALRAQRAGAALFEGWSDEGSWQFILPWPEETRTLSWADASDWKRVVDEVENDDLGTPTELPFSGGWIGFVCYEAQALEEAAPAWPTPTPEPPLFFARHRAGVAVDPSGVAHLFVPEGSEQLFLSKLQDLSAETMTPPPSARSLGSHEVSDSLKAPAWSDRVQRIREAIRNGDVYQVNITRAYSSSREVDCEALYASLTGSQPPRCSAFIRGQGWSIVSASPEIFLRFDRAAGVCETRPIKGTVRRNGDDADEVAVLLGSAKDAAEHLMIVDVSRNDLGKVAPPGSVSVPAYRTVRSLERVHHLESTVRADDLSSVSLASLMAALAPAASITGAPKRAAVGMIRELETVPRGVYCGSIGMIDARGATFSVAIRTAVVAGDSVRFHAGGAIVWDSDADAEEDECRAKAAAFLGWMEER